MSPQTIRPELAELALERADGAAFEAFVHDFFPAIAGPGFVPLGGHHDGGADAFTAPDLRTDPGSAGPARPHCFYQASVETNYAAKIRRTVARLADVGRTPEHVVYVTSRRVPRVDLVEEALSRELGLRVTVRDAGWILAHLNDDARTIAAFDVHLRHLVAFLRDIGRPSAMTASRHVRAPAVYVFLEAEFRRIDGDFHLVHTMTDALILWALEGTDPDLGIFRSADEILTRITAELPGVRGIVRRHLHARLAAMSAKDYPGGRAVRAHRKEGGYCLPYETRLRREQDRAADETLEAEFVARLRARVEAADEPGLGPVGVSAAVEVARTAVQITFERQGLEFSHFLENTGPGTPEFPTMLDAVDAAFAVCGSRGARGDAVREAAFGALRGLLYDSHPAERDYLRKLSRTYTLLFTLQAEPRIIEYFQELAGDFYLYVGSDVLLKALAEYRVPEPDQVTRNTLRIAAQAGATLVLTEPVVTEVVGHLRSCDRAYAEMIDGREDILPDAIIRAVPQLLLRAYLHAHANAGLGDARPVNWPAFVGLFCDYRDLHTRAAFRSVRHYLRLAFGMQYRSEEDLAPYVDEDKVATVAARLAERKKIPELARHDALLASAVYGRRHAHREAADTSEFGLKTWWLTGETSILRLTRSLVHEHGAQYMMRPDFLLNFLAIAPRAADVRLTYRNVFPGLLGVSLGRRMDEETFAEVMTQVAEAATLDDARRTVQIARTVDLLKGEASKRFYVDITDDDLAPPA